MASGIRALSGLMAAAVLGGCYTYRPVEMEDVAPATHVRVTVSGAYEEELALALRDPSRTFTAEYMGDDSGAMTFAVPLVGPVPGSSGPLYNHIVVQPGDVTAVEVREFSRLRTGAVAVAGVVALTFLGIEAFGGGDGGEPKEIPGEDNFRPIGVRIPIGW